jgi:outer membrane receptor for ferrienterochelin and colicin
MGNHVLRLLLAVLIAGAASPVLAQSRPPANLATASLEDLMNITITTASLMPEGAAGAPARVQVITAEQVRRRGYRALSDLLQDLPDFKLDLRGDADYPAQIVVQGSRGSDRVVVLLDGVRISSPTNEPLPILANYPVHAARQIEIVYGPASALYGADAFSAVINIISRDAGDGPGLQISSSIGRDGLYDQTGAFATRFAGGASLLVAGQAQYDRQPDLSRSFPQDFGDLRGQRSGTFDTVFGPMTPPTPVSPTYSIPAAAHSFFSVLRAGGWQFLAFESRSRASTAAPTTPDNGVYNANAFMRNTLMVGSGSYTRTRGAVTSVTSVTYSRHQLDPQSGYQNVYSNMIRSYKFAFGSMWKVDQQMVWKVTPALALTGGGTVERFFSIPQGADLNAPVTSRDTPGTILGTNIPDLFVKVRYRNVGAFGQAQYAVSPAVTATLGARIDDNSRFGVTVNPRAGLVLRPAARTTVKFLAGRAFLAPSPYQAFAHFGSFVSDDGGRTYTSPYWHVPNPDLKPQRKSTLEMSLAQVLAPGLQVSASAVVSRYANLIKTSDADRAYAGTFLGWPVDYIDFAVNEGSATIYGGTFAVDYVRAVGRSGRLAASAGLALVDGRVREEDPTESDAVLPVGSIAPVQFRATVDLDWAGWSVAPRLAIEGAQRLDALTDTFTRRTLPGYTRVDISVRRAMGGRLTAFALVENAFDARYRNINSFAYLNPVELIGAPQNPRRISVGVAITLAGPAKEQR